MVGKSRESDFVIEKLSDVLLTFKLPPNSFSLSFFVFVLNYGEIKNDLYSVFSNMI